ncbi:hypothetical protein ACFLS1_01695 [Verrucomicrobiota bacterium]
MTDGVDILKEVKNLAKRRRGKALMVLTTDYTGQKAWAAELAQQADGQHMDLLDHFAANEELAGKVGAINVEELFELLSEVADAKLLIVTGLEFLRAAWSGQSGIQEAFCHHVETWDKRLSLVFVTQFEKLLENRVSDRFQHQFTFNQKDTFALT